MKICLLYWRPARSVDEVRSADACQRIDGQSYVGFDVSALATLVHNVASAAFGAAMFRAGDNYGFHMGEDSSQCTCQWAPGRGVPYGGSTRRDRDNRYDDWNQDDDDDEWPAPLAQGPNGCTCGYNGDCNCPFTETT